MQVASALANLAILFNQKNEFIKAQPLYERALRIFESNYGPDHPEVAHTLTDLAVLHLERVRVAQGMKSAWSPTTGLWEFFWGGKGGELKCPAK
jgi:hypothetical protein